MFATTCPFPISGISPSETGEFCFRFRVLLFYATQKSVEELAREVIAGKWGNGRERQQRLTAAGYDYRAVQRKVNEMMG